jgi:hypothetical protein
MRAIGTVSTAAKAALAREADAHRKLESRATAGKVLLIPAA